MTYTNSAVQIAKGAIKATLLLSLSWPYLLAYQIGKRCDIEFNNERITINYTGRDSATNDNVSLNGVIICFLLTAIPLLPIFAIISLLITMPPTLVLVGLFELVALPYAAFTDYFDNSATRSSPSPYY